MKRILTFAAICCSLTMHAQTVVTGNTLLDKAFALAVQTIDNNTHDGILEAGGGYGGEWTRDAAMNAWNCTSLLRPEVAQKSLWSVTENNGDKIGHQYWDKIIWTIGAWNHYLVTGNEDFLLKAYPCIKHTMTELENECYEHYYQLFMGPAVFQDGVEAYPEPIFNPKKSDQSSILEHNYSNIKCLSTNCLYYECYKILALMAAKQEPSRVQEYTQKAENLKNRIREVFYKPAEHKIGYVVDQLGNLQEYQEGLGISFAAMFGVLNQQEAADVLKNAWISQHGIVSVYPCFPRNSAEKPGRHNVMVWPHVNMYYADACADCGIYDRFYFELKNVADLAINAGQNDFYEIYTVDGVPSGGYQCGHEWDTKEHQTWCATSYIRNFLLHVFGMDFQEKGIQLSPISIPDCKSIQLKDLSYRGMNLDITVKGKGTRVVDCKINGKSSQPFIPATLTGKVKVEIQL